MVEHPKELHPTIDTQGFLHLEGTILWLDARTCKTDNSINFLSSAQSSRKTRCGQLITTEESAKLLGLSAKTSNVLACQYNRPFSIGRLTMELLPSGAMLGSASLYVETKSASLLYAPTIQDQKSRFSRALQSKPSDILILAATKPHRDTATPARRKEKERLLKDIRSLMNQNQFPNLFCNAHSTAQELTAFLSSEGIPIALERSIHRVSRIYETFGAQLGQYEARTRRSSKRQVWILPDSASREPHRCRPNLVVSGGECGEENSASYATYVLSETSDSSGIMEFIKRTNPRFLYFYGPYARHYVQRYQHCAKLVRALLPPNEAIPLF